MLNTPHLHTHTHIPSRIFLIAVDQVNFNGKKIYNRNPDQNLSEIWKISPQLTLSGKPLFLVSHQQVDSYVTAES